MAKIKSSKESRGMTRKELGEWLNERLGVKIDWSGSHWKRRNLLDLKTQLEKLR